MPLAPQMSLASSYVIPAHIHICSKLGLQDLKHDNLVKIIGVYWPEPCVLSVAMEIAPTCLRRLVESDPQQAQKHQLVLAQGIAAAMAPLG
eukprot:Skav206932  [mRNA]  locus=scaffold1247:13386:13658:- [translate_table: standard]